MLLLKFILANAGLAYLVTKAGITEPLRDKIKETSFIGKILNCPLCFGWWSSWGIYYLVYRQIDPLETSYYSFLGSITAYIIYLIAAQLSSRKL